MYSSLRYSSGNCSHARLLCPAITNRSDLGVGLFSARPEYRNTHTHTHTVHTHGSHIDTHMYVPPTWAKTGEMGGGADARDAIRNEFTLTASAFFGCLFTLDEFDESKRKWLADDRWRLCEEERAQVWYIGPLLLRGMMRAPRAFNLGLGIVEEL